MKHSTMKIMSLILAVCMIISLMPMSVLAEGDTTHTVTLTLSGVTADQTSPITVNDGENCDINLTPASGYTLPNSVTVGGAALNASNADQHDESANYYDANSGRLHLANVTADAAVTVTGIAKPAYTIKMVPADSNYYREANADGESNVAFNIVLVLNNYTRGDFGDVQMYDVTLSYSEALTYNATTAAASSYGNITVDSAARTIRLVRESTDAVPAELTGVKVRYGVTLGTISFDIANANYVDTNASATGVIYAGLTGVTGSVTNPGNQSGSTPANSGYSVRLQHAYLNIKAYSNVQVSYKLNEADAWTDVAKGSTARVQIPYGTLPYYKLTLDPGWQYVYNCMATYVNESYQADTTAASGAHYYNVQLTSTYSQNQTLNGQVLTFQPNWNQANVYLLMNADFTPEVEYVKYTVAYKSGYGDNTSVTNGNYHITDKSAMTGNGAYASRAGYTFVNWKVTTGGYQGAGATDTTAYFKEGNFYGSSTEIPLDNAYGDVVMEAQWTANQHDNTYGTNVTQKSIDGVADSASNPKTDQVVVVTVTPPTGQQISGLTITSSSGTATYTPALVEGAYPTEETDFTFTQPAFNATVTPTFTDIGYAVNYNTDGGSAVSAGTYGISSKSYTVTSTTPTKQGYDFTGWKLTTGSTAGTTKFETSDTLYQAGDVITLDSAYGNVEFTAQWTPAEHATNAYTGVTKTSPEGNPKTGDIVKVTVPDKPGYTTGGITVTPTTGDAITVTTAGEGGTYSFTQPAEDVTVTPIYTANSYTVALNANGGSADATLSVTYDSATVGSITNPTRDGYTFAGWYTASDDTGILVINKDGAFADPQSGYTGTENNVTVWKIANNTTTLYAHWTGAAQSNAALPTGVTSGNGSYTNAHTGDTVSLTITPAEGYYLSGLTIAKADGTGVVTPVTAPDLTQAQGTSQTITYVQPGYGVTVTPTYSGRTYTITMGDTATYHYSYTGPDHFTVTYGSNVLSGGPTTVTTEGSGYVDEYPGVLFVSGQGTNTNYIIKYSTTDGVTTYTLSTVDEKYGASPYITNTGVWKYAGNVEVAPHADTPEMYIAYFNANGGTSVNSFKFGYNTTTVKGNTQKTGYTFAGWYLDEALTVQVIDSTGNLVNNVTYGGETYTKSDGTYVRWAKDLGANNVGSVNLYAKWTPVVQSNIKLPDGCTAIDNTDGSNTWPSIPSGDNVTITVPAKPGYTPTGLTLTLSNSTLTVPTVTDAGDGNPLTWSFDQPGCGVTVTPTYEAVSYTLTYNYNDGATANTTANYTADNSSVTLPQPNRTGYTFAGWKVTTPATAGAFSTADAVLTGTVSLGTSGSSYGDATLTAQWTANIATVTLDSQEATSAGTAAIYAQYNDGCYLTYAAGALSDKMSTTENGINVPTKTGNTFGGYYTEAGGAGTQYIGADGKLTADALSTSFPANVTLYAKWTPNVYTITLDPMPGTTDMTAIYEKYGVGFYSDAACTTETVNVAPPTITGYNFVGYNDTEERIASDGRIVADNTTFTKNTTLKAGYEMIDYAVYFYPNYTGATGSTESTVNYLGTFPTPDVPTRTGYTFAGWYDAETGGNQIVAADGTTINAVDGTTNAKGEYLRADSIGVYAHWTANTYTVTLDAAPNTTYTPTTATMTYGSGVPAITAPTYTFGTNQATFAGWYTSNSADGVKVINADGTANTAAATYFDASGNWIYDGNVTLHARWTRQIVLNDGTTDVMTLTAVYGIGYYDANGNQITTVTVPTKANYSFAGYYLTPADLGTRFVDGTGAITVAVNDAFTATYESASYYQAWSGSIYTITLEDSYGTGGSGAIYERYDDAFYKTNTNGTLSDKMDSVGVAVPTHGGYTFGGYYTGEVGEGTQIIDSSGYIVSTDGIAKTFTANAIIYAKWTENTYTVTYDANGGTVNSNSFTYTTISGDVPLETPTKPGYTFAGWLASGTAVGAFANGQTVKDTASTFSSYGDATLTAQWTAKVVTVTLTPPENYDDAGTAAIYEKYGVGWYSDAECTHEITSITIPTRYGYNFTGYNGGGNVVVGSDGTIMAANTLFTDDATTDTSLWIAKTTNVNFNSNGGTTVGSAYETFGQAVENVGTPTRDGYTFDGWFTSANGGTQVFDATGAFNGSWDRAESTLTLYAQWTAYTSNVTFNLNYDEQTSPYLTFQVTYDQPVTATNYTEPTRTGYTLDGWYDARGVKIFNADGTVIPSLSGWTDDNGNCKLTVTPGSTTDLHAVWTIHSYNNTLGDGVTNLSPNPAAYGATVTATVEDRPGYTVNGLSGSGYGTKTGDNTWTFTQIDQPVTIYAVYVANSYAVSFNKNDGSSDFTWHDVMYNTALTAPTAPTRTGYTFAGWYTGTTDGVQVFDENNAVVKSVSGITDANGNYIKADNLSLYARWVGATQTNSLPGDGTVTQNGTTKTGDEASFTVTPPTGQKIDTLTVTNNTDGSNVSYSPAVKTDGSIQTFTYTQPASGVTVAVTYKNIGYTVTYSANGAAVSGGATSFTVNDTTISLPTTITRPGYTFNGWTISRAAGYTGTVNGGSSDVEKDAESITLEKATGDLTLTAKWLATSNILTVNTADVNPKAAGTATFVAGDGIKSGSGADTGKYFITADGDGKFTVNVSEGYTIDTVTYQINGTGTGTTLTADSNGIYTIPASAAAYPVTLAITTKIDSAKITANAVIKANGEFQTYSQYSGNKSLVLFKVADGTTITGLALSSGVSVYRTDAYAGYQYAALIDLTGITDKSEDGLNAYLQSLLMTKNTANTTLAYNKDVNGLSSGSKSFTIDDVSVEYDYSSKSSLNWIPYDAYLIIGDIAGSGSSSADRVLDSYDVAAFVNAYNA
jgi:uncharacterized repeat protein (TIGR02543 family)